MGCPSLIFGVPVANGGLVGKEMAMQALEEKVAHLTRAVEDLSDVVAVQAREIDRLTRMVAMLAAREAEREAGLGEAPGADVRPPHW
jgi:SlyX protein